MPISMMMFFLYNHYMETQGFVDCHAHMDDQKFDLDRKQILENFLGNDVNRLISVVDAYSENSYRVNLSLLEQFPRLLATSGAHPHQACQYTPDIERKLASHLLHPRIVAIGEIGLDFYYNFSPPADQESVFRRQIAIAAETRLPLVVHSRKAEKMILSILEKEKFNYPVLFHCYTGSHEDAQEIIKRGYYLSFSGIITFKNAVELRKVLSQTPLQKLFLETDSPYLSPEPHRGKTNSPLYMPLIYQCACQNLEIELQQLQSRINQNFVEFFEQNLERN